MSSRRVRLYRRRMILSLRNFGVRYTIWRILEETLLKKLIAQRKFIIYDKDLTEVGGFELANPHLRFSFVSQDDADVLEGIEGISGFPRDLIVERLRTGSECLVAMDGNKVVGFNLASFGNIYIYYLEQRVNLSESAAWSEQISVSKQYWNRGIAVDIRNIMFQHLKQKGHTKFIGGCLELNSKARMLAKKLGFVEREMIAYTRVVKWKKYSSQPLDGHGIELMVDS